MDDTQAIRLGRLIAEARKRRGWSLRETAELTGVPHLWIFRAERGWWHQPDPARLTRLIEALDIDPEKVDRITRGHVSSSLPGVRTYFRAKYDLSPAEIDRIERTVRQIERDHRKQGHA